MEFIETINFVISLGALILFFSGLYLLFDLYTDQIVKPYILRFGLLIAFFITLAGSALTLVYSELFGFIPCGLCWMQRVVLYPQVFMTGSALWIKDKLAAPVYGILFSAIGIVIGLYQHYLQMGGSEFITCPTAGAGADCAKRILFEFGFVTFPLLSVFTFVFLIALYIYIRKISSAQMAD